MVPLFFAFYTTVTSHGKTPYGHHAVWSSRRSAHDGEFSPRATRRSRAFWHSRRGTACERCLRGPHNVRRREGGKQPGPSSSRLRGSALAPPGSHCLNCTASP